MKKCLLFTALLFCNYILQAQENFWRSVDPSTLTNDLFADRYKPSAYKLFQLDERSFQIKAGLAPSENLVTASQSTFILSVPNAEGQLERYSVVDAPVMEPELSAKYPGIRSYAGKGIDHPASIIRFSTGPDGFHAMILSGDRNTIYIDPIDPFSKYSESTYISPDDQTINKDDVYPGERYYVVFYREALKYPNNFHCLTAATAQHGMEDGPHVQRAADDGKLRTFRLALACTGEYAQYFLNGNELNDAERKAKVLAAMNTVMTRTNGIFERDFGIRVNLIANNNAIIYLNPNSDPWTNEFNSKTQQTIDNVIGNNNYDIGHLFHRAANNGDAGYIGSVCKTGQKGSAFTSHSTPVGDPFVVDYSTHEMGHQFGANHTFTYQTEPGTASQFEPGSGSTIMGYAGITPFFDIQPHSDDYFHARSVEQVSDYIKSVNGGAACAMVTITGNTAPWVNAGVDLVIPKSTPFILRGLATDPDAGDILTYTWEQMNLGSTPTTLPNPNATEGPLFRSRPGTTSTSRTFPILSSILDGVNGNTWERLAGVSRTLNFRLLVRDNHPGAGNTKDDDKVITVHGGAGPFAVTAPNTGVTWLVGSTQTINWSVNNTDIAPINCSHVNIFLSTDGGQTFVPLAMSTPNDGSQNITVPNNMGTTNRIKVEASGNIFFDISNVNFTISNVPPPCGAATALTSSSITASSATLSWSSSGSPLSYDVDYRAVGAAAWINAATQTNSLSVNLNGLTASTLYDWRVRTRCNNIHYYSYAQFTTLAPPLACLNAYEPNQTLASAALVATNMNISAAIGTNTDDDYYRIAITETSNFNITLSNLPADYDLLLYNAGGALIDMSVEYGNSNENITLANQVAGTYYVRVVGFNGAYSTSVCYNLYIGAVTAGCSNTYDISSNGTANGAANIPFNTNITGLINPKNDEDYYRFVITNGGTATITLSTLPDNYDLRLYSSNGTTQLASSSNNGTANEIISRTYTPGTYYVKVFGHKNERHPTLCYTLKVQLGTASREDHGLITVTKVSAFPNPVTNKVNLNIPGIKGTASISVFDMYGKKVMQTTTANINSEMDLSRLASGVYMIRVINDGKEGMVKVVKE